ncbi:sialidase family protein [candidate division KSB1 bacterium]
MRFLKLYSIIAGIFLNQINLSAQDCTLPIPVDSIWEPQFIYTHSSNNGTPIIEPDGKTIHFYHRRASFDSGSINVLYEDVSYDGGYTWYFDKPVLNTGDKSRWELANVNPYNGEIYLMYVRDAKGRLIRTTDNRTKWSDEITLPFTFDFTSGSLIWLEDIESSGFHRMIMATTHGNDTLRSGYDFTREMYTYHSDDDGQAWAGPSARIYSGNSWKAPSNMKMYIGSPDWSPFMVELEDGRIQMFTRNDKLYHWQFFSDDRGVTWDKGQPTRFYGIFSNTRYIRIHDGRIVHMWLNSIPWHDKETGVRVLSGHNTARDIIHAAISDNEGKTFRGYREVTVDPQCHDSLYSVVPSYDAGQHHQKFVVTKDNKVIVWTGQDDYDILRESKHRQTVIFELGWLYETKRNIDFSNGYEGLHVWKLSDDRVGATNYRSRILGATIIDHPTQAGKKTLELRSENNEKVNFYDTEGTKFTYGVLTPQDGAVWNFPTGPEGSVSTRILLRSGFKGGMISLTNGFWNPADPRGDEMAMYSLNIPANGQINSTTTLAKEKWITLTLGWDKSNMACKVYVDNVLQKQTLPIKNKPGIDGINYVRFRSTAESEDLGGFLVESIEADVTPSYSGVTPQ